MRSKKCARNVAGYGRFLVVPDNPSRKCSPFKALVILHLSCFTIKLRPHVVRDAEIITVGYDVCMIPRAAEIASASDNSRVPFDFATRHYFELRAIASD
jgi:hypothetical protein